MALLGTPMRPPVPADIAHGFRFPGPVGNPRFVTPDGAQRAGDLPVQLSLAALAQRIAGALPSPEQRLEQFTSEHHVPGLPVTGPDGAQRAGNFPYQPSLAALTERITHALPPSPVQQIIHAIGAAHPGLVPLPTPEPLPAGFRMPPGAMPGAVMPGAASTGEQVPHPGAIPARVAQAASSFSPATHLYSQFRHSQFQKRPGLHPSPSSLAEAAASRGRQ